VNAGLTPTAEFDEAVVTGPLGLSCRLLRPLVVAPDQPLSSSRLDRRNRHLVGDDIV
jgi:hypothetical protein